MAASISIIYICTSLSSPYYHAASFVINLLQKATFTSTFQPTLGLALTLASLVSALDIPLAIRYSLIFSRVQTISTISDLLYPQLSFYSSFSINLFVPNSIPSSLLLPYFSNISPQEHSLFIFLHVSFFSAMPLEQLLTHTDTFSHLYPII